jgi:hypothetical protein
VDFEPPTNATSGQCNVKAQAPRHAGSALVRWVVAATLAATAAAVVAGGTSPRAGFTPQAPSTSDTAYDQVSTDTARVLAGLQPVDAARFDAATRQPAWRAYREDVDRNWSRLEAERFAVMRSWRDREFKALADSCDTLFYPFGGPDFINAQVIFPGCSRYLLFGLEPVGSVPALDPQHPAGVDVLLSELRASLSDVFVRDYFITKEMMNELRTPVINGTLPLLMVFLARLDARIVDVRMESPWAESDSSAPAAAAPGPAQGPSTGRRQAPRATGVTITFLARGSSRVQTLVYARVRMEDAEFPKQDALRAYLDRHAPFTTLLKSASYLLHDRQFSGVRSEILSHSRAVLQSHQSFSRYPDCSHLCRGCGDRLADGQQHVVRGTIATRHGRKPGGSRRQGSDHGGHRGDSG